MGHLCTKQEALPEKRDTSGRMEVGWKELKTLHSQLHTLDNLYLAPTIHDLQEIFTRFGRRARKYRIDSYDCDDFAWGFTNEARRYADEVYGKPLAIGFAIGLVDEMADEWDTHHAFCTVVMPSSQGLPELRCIEPQGRAIQYLTATTIDIILM